MSIQEGSISFSNMEVQSDAGGGSDREWRRLKFEAGKSYRIKFIDNNLEMRYRHWNPIEVPTKKGYYRCLGHTGYCPVCVAASNGWGGEGKLKLKKAQEIFGANVLVYTTDATGNPIQPLNAEVYFWSLNAKKFVALRSIQQDWGDITQLDLKLTCADAQAEQFQDVSISNLPTCLYNSDPAFKAQCDAKIEKDKYPLAKMLCKEVSVQDMVAVFGLPQSYLPQDMLSQMPQAQQTVTDYANGIQPQVQQSVQTQQVPPVTQQVQPQMQTFPQGGLNYQQAPTPGVVPAPVQTPNPVVADVNGMSTVPAQQTIPVQPAPQMQQVVQPQMVQSQVTPIPEPIQQAAPSQVQPQAPEDAYADLDALQNILG